MQILHPQVLSDSDLPTCSLYHVHQHQVALKSGQPEHMSADKLTQLSYFSCNGALKSKWERFRNGVLAVLLHTDYLLGMKGESKPDCHK